MTLKFLFSSVIIFALALPGTCFADDSVDVDGANAIGSRLIAVRVISKSCTGVGTPEQDQAIASSRSEWDARNAEYVRAMRVYVGFAAGSLEKEMKGFGQKTLVVIRDDMAEAALPLIKAALGSPSVGSCQLAIQKIAAGELDVTTAGNRSQVDSVKKEWGPLFIESEHITFDIMPIIDGN